MANRYAHQPAGAFARDELEVGRVAPDDGTQRNEGGISARLGHDAGDGREVERSVNPVDFEFGPGRARFEARIEDAPAASAVEVAAD